MNVKTFSAVFLTIGFSVQYGSLSASVVSFSQGGGQISSESQPDFDAIEYAKVDGLPVAERNEYRLMLVKIDAYRNALKAVSTLADERHREDTRNEILRRLDTVFSESIFRNPHWDSFKKTLTGGFALYQFENPWVRGYAIFRIDDNGGRLPSPASVYVIDLAKNQAEESSGRRQVWTIDEQPP